MPTSASPARPSRVVRNAAAIASGGSRPSHPRGASAPSNHQASFRARLGNAARTSNAAASSRTSRTPPSLRDRASLGEASNGVRGRRLSAEASHRADFYGRVPGLMSELSNIPGLSAHMEDSGSRFQEERTLSEEAVRDPTFQPSRPSVSTRASSQEDVNTPIMRPRRQAGTPEEHSQDERMRPEDEPPNPMLRPRRYSISQLQERSSVPVRAPPVLMETSSEDVAPSQGEDEMSYASRCPVCTLPMPCDKHSHGEEDRDLAGSASSTESAPSPPATATSSNLASSRVPGSQVSGIYRRPRRRINSRVEDDQVAQNSAASQAADNRNTPDHAEDSQLLSEDVVSRRHDPHIAVPVARLNHAILNRVMQSESAPTNSAGDDDMDNSNNRLDSPTSSSQRKSRSRKKMKSKAKDNACSGEVDDCPICLAPLLGRCAKTKCGHHFHVDCLEQHLLITAVERPNCPICRADMKLTLPVSAEAASGLAMEVLHRVPSVDTRCHLDRAYTFLSLGGFAGRPKMLYVLTSNEDKWTPSNAVMWTLTATVPTTVYLNFRSLEHVTETGARKWLRRGGWTAIDLESTVSTGWPNGPYEGPVFSKDFNPGEIELMGSNCHEGTYFVFVELRDKSGFDLPWDLREVLD